MRTKRERLMEQSITTLPPRPSDALYPPDRNEKYQAMDRTLMPTAIAGRYNNFYEFTTDKADVARLASKFTIDPWTIEVSGLVQKPFQIGFEDLIKKFPLESEFIVCGAWKHGQWSCLGQGFHFTNLWSSAGLYYRPNMCDLSPFIGPKRRWDSASVAIHGPTIKDYVSRSL
jgi:hypothetical protein